MADFKELELIAAHNEELPDGLTQSEIKLFFNLRSLYSHYKDRKLSQDQAIREKAKIVAAYKEDSERDEHYKTTIGLWARVEQPAIAYTKNPTIENADNFFRAVYRLDGDWRVKR